MRFLLWTMVSFSLSFAIPAYGCDLCAIYNSFDTSKTKAGNIHLGLAEQFNYFGSIRDNGTFKPNQYHQHLASSITQLFASYDLSDQLSLQATVPYINRRFQRFHDGEVRRGTEAGIGDSSLLMNATIYSSVIKDRIFSTRLRAGLKMPTGASDRLAEESDETDTRDIVPTALHARHGEDEHGQGAIHGHDLALGSGSFDFPLGMSVAYTAAKVGIFADLQYTFRTEGDHNYRYANDLLWEAGPGYYFTLEHDNSLLLRIDLSGEYKRKDFGGEEREGDTGIRALFLGPALEWSLDNRVSAQLGIDLPLDINTTGLQAVSDYKLKVAATYHF